MCAAPYYVASKMSKIRQSTLTVPSPGSYAANVLNQVRSIIFLLSSNIEHKNKHKCSISEHE